MSATRTRQSLGRSSLDLDMGLPPSPSHDTLNIPSLADLINRQTPRSRTVQIMSPAIPDDDADDDDVDTSASMSSFVRSRSLDDELLRTGYTPISKMVVISPNGQSHVEYIKAENEIGEPVYIAVDVDDAFVSQTASDPRLKESRIGMNIDPEEKELVFSKAGLGVAGVAFECRNGLCTILHDEQMQAPREQNYVLIHTTKMEETLVLASFPVVKMSDIRANPQACLKNVDLALRRIRNASLHKCQCEINEVQEKFKKFATLFDQTLETKEKVIREFKRTMNLLEDAYDKCVCAPCPEKNQHRIKEIVYNIEKRNAKYPHLVESCKDIASLGNSLEDAICLLEEAKHKLEKKFRHLHCAYELKDKKHHHHHCAWEHHQEEEDTSSDEE